MEEVKNEKKGQSSKAKVRTLSLSVGFTVSLPEERNSFNCWSICCSFLFSSSIFCLRSQIKPVEVFSFSRFVQIEFMLHHLFFALLMFLLGLINQWFHLTNLRKYLDSSLMLVFVNWPKAFLDILCS